MNEPDEFKALDTYYETANAHFDRLNGYFDQIDTKAGILVAILAGVPIATLGFAFRLGKGELDVAAACSRWRGAGSFPDRWISIGQSRVG